jgi:hypothetical protein
MAVDALASAIEKGGGLGLSKCIERAIHPETTHAPKSGPSGTEPTAEPSAIGDARSESMRLRTHNR